MFINLLSRCLYFSWGCVKSLVFKGVNELLLNFFHVIRAIKGINRTKTLGISYQTIIISTTGVAPTSHKVFEGVAVPLTLVASAFSMDSKETLIPFKNVRLSGYVLSEVQPNHLVCTGESCLTGYMNNYIIDAKVLIEKFHSLGYQANIIPFNTGDSGRCFIASFNPRGKSSVNLCLLVVLKSTPEKHKRKCWDFLQSINNTETT
jgi:adenine C2-methylase RlmN of 23S rRNA A2503 and tRNA A37